MPIKRLLGAVAGLALSLSVTARAHAEDVVVFAAASLTNALNEIGESFTARTGHKMVPSYAASSALAKQVEQGGPGQVFASADLKWMDYLADKKLINGETRFNLLGNTLVLIAPLDAKQGKIELTAKTDIAVLAGTGRIATGNPESVPVGLYFKQAMERAGQWKAIESKIAATDSVRAALAFVERGEVPLGVVYATDAAVSKKVKVVGVFPDTMHDPIVYPFALIAGKETPAAKALLDAIKSPEAKGVFAKYGFKIN
ncbi:Molybdenum ABC transporter periplasmic molybdenum-binding protein ModA [Paramagnetospirillum magnetotacticum MS-1]|uniref:Molybdenum ABC transporter periplasmic molybdenum-binding protein ModA n=1 Tax=Paramagnetospirillum magnetotacticum MS-1 TaxID=272627 RepID=A0A0C2YWH0_PARME|nr:molybdate ABC transporter substrate-binding protein [Paramagnetospirillum magnetotacticum]KIL99473.1 Molybdenum ABC transporter periplasmic molybdenum-binding protein ModA [Paramagnetospirillum magnetotacticum MS-1]